MIRLAAVLLLFTVSEAVGQVSFPRQPTGVSPSGAELAVQVERQSGDIRVLSARIQSLEQSASGSFQRLETDLSKNTDQHRDFERRIDELRYAFRVYPWLFTALGAGLALVAQHFISRWLRRRFPDQRPPAAAAP